MKRLLQLSIISLCAAFSICSCTRVEKSTEQQENNLVTTTETESFVTRREDVVEGTQIVHVFIENSGSMNGYINETSDFQEAIGNALAKMQMKPCFSEIKAYYVNQKIHATPEINESTELYKFVQKMLQKEEFTTSGTHKVDPGRSTSDLNKIIGKILNDTAVNYVDENNTAILISDCIYSLDNNNQSSLSGCKNLTMLEFGKKVKKNPNLSLATNIIQLTSKFKGKYWTWDKPTGNQYVNLNCQRPYYMCVIGTDANVRQFNKSINISELEGYKNQYTISNNEVSNSAFTVLESKYRVGLFRHNKGTTIHEINKVSCNSNGQFGFSIGVDLSHFTMSESDKIDESNYKITCGDYTLESIEAVDLKKITSPTDCQLLKDNNCTHIITVSCSGFPTDLTIDIKRTVPSWIKESSSDDDRRILSSNDEQMKTYGIEYFVRGISDAYLEMARDAENFMTINVKVKK